MNGTPTAYAWSGNRYQADANVIGPIIEELQEKHGPTGLPRALWQSARKKAHPCHSLYPETAWDDQHMADLMRDELSRKIIRSLRIVEAKREVPAFISLSVARIDVAEDQWRERGYYSTTREVQFDESLQDAYATELRIELARLKAKYANWRGFVAEVRAWTMEQAA